MSFVAECDQTELTVLTSCLNAPHHSTASRRHLTSSHHFTTSLHTKCLTVNGYESEGRDSERTSDCGEQVLGLLLLLIAGGW